MKWGQCPECGRELVQAIKPDAPEWFDVLCETCGIIEGSYRYPAFTDADYRQHSVSHPRYIPVRYCLKCGRPLRFFPSPRGGRPVELCRDCYLEKRRKEWKDYKVRTRKNEVKP